jgi:hypothetical protein
MNQAMTQLAARTIYLGGMHPKKFLPVLNAFGPLPEEGQRELAERLVGRVGEFRLAIGAKGLLPSEERDDLTQIAQAAKDLLKMLGVDNPQMLSSDVAKAQLHSWACGWLLPEFYKVGTEKRPATAAMAAHERWITLLLLLSDVKEAAERCALMAMHTSPRDRNRRGRGGTGRRGPDPKGRLLCGLFETYSALRRRYPDSGPPLARKRPSDFVSACLTLAASSAPAFTGKDGARYELWDEDVGVEQSNQTTPKAINSAFDRWKKRRPNP